MMIEESHLAVDLEMVPRVSRGLVAGQGRGIRVRVAG